MNIVQHQTNCKTETTEESIKTTLINHKTASLFLQINEVV
jgi:hypothetical protein